MTQANRCKVELTINGAPVVGDVEPRTLLVEFLRRDRALTGAHVGCDTSQCGACTVLVDGKAIKSCTMLVVQAAGASITTVEGVASGGALHPIQHYLREKHGLQCGFCTPGMVMIGLDLLSQGPALSAERIREGLEGNLCRCTGYQNIVDALVAASAAMTGSSV